MTRYEALSHKIWVLEEKARTVKSKYVKSIYLGKARELKEIRGNLTLEQATAIDTTFTPVTPVTPVTSESEALR